MKLYEIANEYQQFMESVEAGLIPEEAIADTLECITMALDEKADNIACLIKNLNAEALAIKAEEERLTERRKSKEKEADRLTQYLSDILLQSGYKTIETARNKITFRKNPPKVVIDDEKAFIEWATDNAKYFLKYANPTVNKTAVKDAITSGAVVMGAQIISEERISIK